MFQLFRKKGNKVLTAVADGQCIPMKDVRDPAFAAKALGEGVAICPESDTIVAPCDGTLSLITPTRHAFAMEREDGLELMVHIGIDTVALNGEGFEVLTQAGQAVKKGQPIIRFDPEVMREKKIDMTTMLILLNHEAFEIKALYHGRQVKKGEDTVIEYS